MKAFDPTREERLSVNVPGPDGTLVAKEYRLRLGMAELLVAERQMGLKQMGLKISAADASSQGGTVAAMIETFTDGTLDSLMTAFSVMVRRAHPRLTNGEVWEVFDADLEGVQRAVYSLLGKTLPEADPKEPPAADAIPTETPTEETVAVGT